VVQREIEDEISERILTGHVGRSQDITVDFVDGEFVFKVSERAVEAV
jgi:ATP-dependent Clp protease ATP-binding subunit ClpA